MRLLEMMNTTAAQIFQAPLFPLATTTISSPATTSNQPTVDPTTQTDQEVHQ
jgi:hypothetical protein